MNRERSPKLTAKRTQIAADYLSGAGSAREIAAHYGVNHVTVLNAKDDPEARAAAVPLLADLREQATLLAHKLLKRYNEIADTATFDDKSSTALGITLDKVMLLHGMATERIETLTGLSPEMLETLRQIVQRRREQGEQEEQIRLALVSGFPEVQEHLDRVM